jgi:hypothetical protein
MARRGFAVAAKRSTSGAKRRATQREHRSFSSDAHQRLASLHYAVAPKSIAL